MNGAYSDQEFTRSHLPMRFESWPREQQIDFFETTRTRAGLIASVLSLAGEDVSERDLHRHYYLTKRDLAALHIVLEEIR